MSNDVKMIKYKLSKKSMVLAYIFNVFFHGIGLHRFYMRRYKSAVAMLLLNVIGVFIILGVVLLPFLLGNEHISMKLFLIGIILGELMVITVLIWAIVDLFLVHKWVKVFNYNVLEELDF